jgi:hypothetical protein
LPHRETRVGGFGDLVVLINPAFEALLFTPMSDMAAARAHYPEPQVPVLAILTSKGDSVTKTWFRIGRRISTIFERENENKTERYNATMGKQEVVDQNEANITAVGHFEPYRTHELHVDEAKPNVFDVRKEWMEDRRGGKIEFKGSVLVRTENSAGRNPYLVVQVDDDENLIEGHTAIYGDGR